MKQKFFIKAKLISFIYCFSILLITQKSYTQFSVGIESGININSTVDWFNVNPKTSWGTKLQFGYRINKTSKIGLNILLTQNNDEYNYSYKSEFPYYQNEYYGLPSEKNVRLFTNSNYLRFSLNYILNTDLNEKIYMSINSGLGIGYLYSIQVSAFEKNPQNMELYEDEYFINGKTDRSRIDPFVEFGGSLVYQHSNKINFSINSNLLVSVVNLNKNEEPIINNAYQHHFTSDKSIRQTKNLMVTLGVLYKINLQKNEK